MAVVTTAATRTREQVFDALALDPVAAVGGYHGELTFKRNGTASFSLRDSGSALVFAALASGTHYPIANVSISGTTPAWSFVQTPTVGANTMWHAGNDGAGSGLDADRLDTYHAADFPRKAEVATISAAWTFSSALTLGTQATAATHALAAGRTLTLTSDTNVTITNSGSAQDLTANRSWTLGWSGQLAVARGGTGRATLASNQLLYGAGTSAVAQSANLTFNGTALALTGTATIVGATSITGDVTVTGSETVSETLSSADALTGNVGGGWAIKPTGASGSKRWSFTIDDLIVRGTLRAAVFQKDVIKVSNGRRMETDGTVLTHDVSIPNPTVSPAAMPSVVIKVKENTFYAGDLLIIKDVIDPNGVSLSIPEVRLTVVSVNNTAQGTGPNAYYEVTCSVDYTSAGGGPHALKVGMSVARVGNTTDPTRRGLIYSDANPGSSGPFIDIIDGVSSWAAASVEGGGTYSWNSVFKTRSRLGDLSGVTVNGTVLAQGTDADRYGFFSNRAVLTKNVVVGRPGAERISVTDGAIEIYRRDTTTGTPFTALGLAINGTSVTIGEATNAQAVFTKDKLTLGGGRIKLEADTLTDVGTIAISPTGTEKLYGSAVAGVLMSATGGATPAAQFEAYGDAANYIRFTSLATAPKLEIKTSSLALATTGESTIRFGATTFTAGAGIWIDQTAAGVASFRVGDTAGAYFSFAENTSVFNLYGKTATGQQAIITTTATSATVVGYTFSGGRMVAGATTATEVGLSAATGDSAFWAGGTAAAAPFRVTHEGDLHATSATIEGDITATSGTIGGWSISGNVLQNTANGGIYLDAGAQRITVGAAGNYAGLSSGIFLGRESSDSKFRLGSLLTFTGGVLTVGGATGWVVSTGQMSATNVTLSAAGRFLAFSSGVPAAVATYANSYGIADSAFFGYDGVSKYKMSLGTALTYDGTNVALSGVSKADYFEHTAIKITNANFSTYFKAHTYSGKKYYVLDLRSAPAGFYRIEANQSVYGSDAETLDAPISHVLFPGADTLPGGVSGFGSSVNPSQGKILIESATPGLTFARGVPLGAPVNGGNAVHANALSALDEGSRVNADPEDWAFGGFRKYKVYNQGTSSVAASVAYSGLYVVSSGSRIEITRSADVKITSTNRYESMKVSGVIEGTRLKVSDYPGGTEPAGEYDTLTALGEIKYVDNGTTGEFWGYSRTTAGTGSWKRLDLGNADSTGTLVADWSNINGRPSLTFTGYHATTAPTSDITGATLSLEGPNYAVTLTLRDALAGGGTAGLTLTANSGVITANIPTITFDSKGRATNIATANHASTWYTKAQIDSVFATQAYVDTAVGTAPSAPTSVTATFSGGVVTIGWSGPASASAVDHYQIYDGIEYVGHERHTGAGPYTFSWVPPSTVTGTRSITVYAVKSGNFSPGGAASPQPNVAAVADPTVAIDALGDGYLLNITPPMTSDVPDARYRNLRLEMRNGVDTAAVDAASYTTVATGHLTQFFYKDVYADRGKLHQFRVTVL